jgi:hypothetical protein
VQLQLVDNLPPGTQYAVILEFEAAAKRLAEHIGGSFAQHLGFVLFAAAFRQSTIYANIPTLCILDKEHDVRQIIKQRFGRKRVCQILEKSS